MKLIVAKVQLHASLEEALVILSSEVNPKQRHEKVGTSHAYARVLAEDVTAWEDLPRRDVSHFDGVAIRGRHAWCHEGLSGRS